MTIRNPSSLVAFDADAGLEAARETAGDAVHLCVEYDMETFNTLYADELTLSLYDDERAMLDHFEEVVSYVHVDFMEKDLFEDVFRGGGDVRAFVTCMENVSLVRIIVGQNGLFLTVDPGADLTALVGAVENAIEASDS